MKKSDLRDALPKHWQIPIKYWLNRIQGLLEPELLLLPYILDKGDHVVDIGANRGIYVYVMRKMGMKIDAFEPNPDCSRLLEAWAKGDPLLCVHSIALSDHIGEAELRIPIDANGVEHDASASLIHNGLAFIRPVTVPLKTLDSFNFTDVKFIKIDVEGSERAVLEGGIHTLRSCKPALLIEIEQRHSSTEILCLIKWIQNQGYEGFYLDNNYLRPIQDFDLERDQALSNLSRPGNKYINNFLFLFRSWIDSGRYQRLMHRLLVL